MKSIKLLLMAVAFVLTNSIYAIHINPSDKRVKSVISQEIQNLLKKPGFLIEKDMLITVQLTVNKKNEIVVLSVNANSIDYEVESFIKSRLNYKKISKKIETKVYILPIKLVSAR